MSMSDPIADMLTRIRNANIAKHDTVDVPSSKMKKAIADIRVAEGYVKGYEVIEENAEGSAFTPPTPQEMAERISAARIITKEMKAQARKDARMAKRVAAKEKLEAPVEELDVEAVESEENSSEE